MEMMEDENRRKRLNVHLLALPRHIQTNLAAQVVGARCVQVRLLLRAPIRNFGEL